jgi:hypothetical protein
MPLRRPLALSAAFALRAEIETGGRAAPPPEKYIDLSYYRRAMSALGE